MATNIKDTTIASTYKFLVKRDSGTYSQTGMNVELQNDSGVALATGLYLESGAVTDFVGIGTATPDVPLHISSTGDTSVRIKGGSDGSGNSYLLLDAGGDSDYSKVIFQKAGVSLGDISYDHDATEASATMKFSINTPGSIDPQMTILGNGKVGIGTTAPTSLLHVENSSTTDYNTTDSGTSASLNTLAYLKNASTGALDNAMIQIVANTAQSFIGTIYNSANNGDLVFGTDGGSDGVERMRIMNAGNVGIGTTSPTSSLEIESPGAGHLQLSLYCANSSGGDPLIRFGGANDTGDSADADFDWGCGVDRSENTFEIRYSSGGITEMSSASWFSMTNAGVLTIDAGTVTSDERLKKDITDLSNPLATINSLKGKTFKWKDAMSPSGIQYGMIAQEVELVIPELVMESTCKQLNPDGTIFKGDNLEDTMTVDEAVAARNLTNTKTVNMNGVIPILIEAVKELSAKVTALEGEDSTNDAKIVALEVKDTASEASIAALTARIIALENA